MCDASESLPPTVVALKKMLLSLTQEKDVGRSRPPEKVVSKEINNLSGV